LTGKDVQVDKLNLKNLITVDLDIADQNYLIKGDIVFKSKGSEHICRLIDKSVPKLLAAIPLMVVRLSPRIKNFEPEFLAYFLNTSTAQQYFNQCASFTTIKFITKAVLSELIVPIIPLEDQRKIINISNMIEREKFLEKQLLEKKTSLIDSLLRRYTAPQKQGVSNVKN
jgi:restriction endonuclease S subunit